MADRMSQISLRQFRERIAEIHEPVEVSRRDGQGNIRVLGYWTPYMQEAPVENVPLLGDHDPLPGGTTAVRDGQYVRELPSIRPFPKSAQTGKKK